MAVPEGLDDEPVRSFSCFTGDLEKLADWLVQIGIQTVAMESTGIYWAPCFEILEERGLEVLLVNTRHVKNVSGRKSDVLDCQWLQQLHTYGLLVGAFRPPEQITALRAYLRQRGTLVYYAGCHIQHMQKALRQMNVLLDNVVSDITGMTIIRAILRGEHDPERLAAYRDGRCKRYDTYTAKILVCDEAIDQQLKCFDTQGDPQQLAPSKKQRSANAPAFDVRSELYRI